MTTSADAGKAETQYRAAHSIHYTDKDLRGALELYLVLMKEYPDSVEAAYARTQIDNIVKSIVSASDLLASHVDLVSARLTETETAAQHEDQEPTD